MQSYLSDYFIFLLQNGNANEIKGLNGRNANAGNTISPQNSILYEMGVIEFKREKKNNNNSNFPGVSSNANLRFEEQPRSFYPPSNQYDFGTDVKSHREISDNFEQKARNRRDVNEVSKEKARSQPYGTWNSFQSLMLNLRQNYTIKYYYK